jgi:hypothetical protein
MGRKPPKTYSDPPLAAMTTIPKKLASVTEEFAILPGTDEIQKRIIKDADERINEIKMDLHKQVSKSVNGKGSARFNVPQLYVDYALHSLKKWTKLHGYAMKVEHNEIIIHPKNQKLPKERCISCRSRRLSMAHNIIRFGVLGASCAGFIIVWTWILGG